MKQTLIKVNANRGQVFLLLMVFMSIVIVSLLIYQIRGGGEPVGDRVLSDAIQSQSGSVLTFIFTLLTELGSKYGIGGLFIVSLIYIGWKFKDYAAMMVLTVGVIGGDQLNKWLKEVIGRERPMIDLSIDAEGYSFPSGHAMVGLIFYGFLAYYWSTKITSEKAKVLTQYGIFTLVFLIGFSRIVLNAHYPSDVYGGFATGFLALLLCIGMYKVLKPLKFARLKRE